MRVNGTAGDQTSLGSFLINANRSGTADVGTADAVAGTGLPDVSYGSASAIRQLLDGLQQIPLIRQEVIGEVAKLLGGGQLDTPQARQQSVQAMLGVAPGHD